MEKKADGTVRAKVYIRQYKAWRKVVDKQKRYASFSKIIRTANAAAGLRIVMNGRVQPPKLQKNKSVSRGAKLDKNNSMLATISICHCAYASLDKLVGKKSNRARKGEKVGEVGSTGTGVPHAHVDMWVHRGSLAPAGKTRKGKTRYKRIQVGDDEQFKAVAAANREYMETLLLMKVTGGKPDSNQISPEWQQYFKSRGVKVNNVREAVAILFKSHRFFRGNADDTRDKILTNAFFFFRPDEIVVGVNTYDDYKNVFYSSKSIKGQGDEEKANSNTCGKLPEAYSRKLRVELKTCLLKTGKAFSRNKKSYRYRKRLKCERTYKQKLAALETQWRLKLQAEGKTDQKLAAQTDKGLRDKAQRPGPDTPRKNTTS